MMIGLYYVEHHPFLDFLSRLRELWRSYGYKFFLAKPSNHRTYHHEIAGFAYRHSLPGSSCYGCNEYLHFPLYSKSPHLHYPFEFNLLKEIFFLSPLRDSHIRVFLSISFPLHLPFHLDVHCIMPEGIARLLPLCTTAQIPK